MAEVLDIVIEVRGRCVVHIPPNALVMYCKEEFHAKTATPKQLIFRRKIDSIWIMEMQGFLWLRFPYPGEWPKPEVTVIEDFQRFDVREISTPVNPAYGVY